MSFRNARIPGAGAGKEARELFWKDQLIAALRGIQGLDISVYERVVIDAIADCIDKFGRCYPGLETIALKAGVKLRTALNVVKRLAERGEWRLKDRSTMRCRLIKKVGRSRFGTTIYELNLRALAHAKECFDVAHKTLLAGLRSKRSEWEMPELSRADMAPTPMSPEQTMAFKLAWADGCASGRAAGGAEEYAEAQSVFHELLSEGSAVLDAARAALDGQSACVASEPRLMPSQARTSDKPAKRRQEHARAEATAQFREVETFELVSEPERPEARELFDDQAPNVIQLRAAREPVSPGAERRRLEPKNSDATKPEPTLPEPEQRLFPNGEFAKAWARAICGRAYSRESRPDAAAARERVAQLLDEGIGERDAIKTALDEARRSWDAPAGIRRAVEPAPAPSESSVVASPRALDSPDVGCDDEHARRESDEEHRRNASDEPEVSLRAEPHHASGPGVSRAAGERERDRALLGERETRAG